MFVTAGLYANPLRFVRPMVYVREAQTTGGGGAGGGGAGGGGGGGGETRHPKVIGGIAVHAPFTIWQSSQPPWQSNW